MGLVSLKPWRKQPDSLHDFFLHINENEKNTTKDNLATTRLSFLTIKHWHHYTRLNSSLTFSVRFPSNIALLESEMETVMEFSSKIGSGYIFMKISPLEGYIKSLTSSFVEVSTMKVKLIIIPSQKVKLFFWEKVPSNEETHFLFLALRAFTHVYK